MYKTLLSGLWAWVPVELFESKAYLMLHMLDRWIPACLCQWILKRTAFNSNCGLREWDDMNLPLLSHLTHNTGSHSLLALRHGHRSVPQGLFTVVFPPSSWVLADMLDLSAFLDLVHWHPRHLRIQGDKESVAVLGHEQKPVQWALLRAQGHRLASVQGPECVHG